MAADLEEARGKITALREFIMASGEPPEAPLGYGPEEAFAWEVGWLACRRALMSRLISSRP